MALVRLSRALGRLATRRPWTALTGSFLACLALAVPALGMRLDTDFLRLLPEHAPAVRDFVDIAHTFGSTDTLVAVVEASDAPADAALDADHHARARAIV